jgi:hypothetical protein
MEVFMKSKTLCIIISALMFFGSLSQAAHFVHSGGMLWSQVGGWALDADESDPYKAMSRFDPALVHSFTSSTVSAANCSQDGQFSAVVSGSTLTVSGTVAADGQVTAMDGSLNSYAGFSAVQAGVTGGIYFTLVADTGENNGDLATIELTFTANGLVTGLGQASFGGGMGASDVIVAVNLPLPAPETIDPENIAYSHAGMQQVSSFNVNDTAVFKVKIGHTIAIFLGANVSVDLGPNYIGSTDMTASAAISLDIVNVRPYVSICEECDLDSSGQIDLGDFKMLAEAWLSDAYPFPSPPPPPPGPGETCATAYDLWVGPSASGQLSAGQSIWYKVTPGTNACYTIELCNSNFDTAVELYEDCGGYIQGFDDDGCAPQSKLQAQMQAWHTYYLRIRGKTTTDSGYYEVIINEGCSAGTNTGSDDCEDAPQVYLDEPVTDDTTGATGTDETEDCGYAPDNRDLWYIFTAPSNGDYVIRIDFDSPSNFAGTLAIFDMCGGNMYSCTETYMNSAQIYCSLNEDEVLLIRVASYEFSEDQYELSISLD